jgi:hypothetical protein
MNKSLVQTLDRSLLDDPRAYRKIELNYRKNKEQDNSAIMDALADEFCYEDCRDRYWNPEMFSLLYGTPLWEQSDARQRRSL